MQKLLGKFKGQRRSNGFTLVELVVVVAVVGVLGAVAAPKLLGVGESARQAQLDSVAAALSAVSASNYASREASGFTVGTTVDGCEDVGPMLEVPLTALVGAITVAAAANDARTLCTLTSPAPVLTSTFYVYGSA
jgi:prepilin-type N-terminal cleavage/methylation domain-containing protein